MQATNKIRFESFSDGVFAIGMTLLALGLRVPVLTIASYRTSFQELIPIIPSILTFVLSFIAIAIFWVNHQQLSQNISRITKRRILWLNILFLLFVTLVPFVTQTLSASIGSLLSVSMYAFVFFGAAISFSILRYCIHKMEGQRHIPMGRSVVGPILYFLAIFTPIISIPLTYSLLLIPPLFYFLPKASVSNS
ncbi:MAG TPA: TMEM175 family protein [Candidatus Paceibacterota bacterium]|jgi:uncharacterized membrane protein|nr:TMEM175 family protein [Candidatus Paceibacterota bacterium]